MKHTATVFVIISLILLFQECSTRLSGSTETTNQIVGMLYEPDGVTPAEGATVIVRTQNTLAAIADIPSGEQAGALDTVFSDKDGTYSFNVVLEEGAYCIEATKNDNAAFISSVMIDGADDKKEIDPETLKPTGVIAGELILPGGGDPTEVYVLAFGIDRFAQVKNDGTFLFGGLGEGSYHIRIITTLDGYESFDTLGVTVTSSATTEMGQITLPFDGVAVPQKVKVLWETGGRKALISWERAISPKVKYYNVFRAYDLGNGHSEIPLLSKEQLNKFQITDTFFIDSTMYNKTYPNEFPDEFLYTVSAVDENERESRECPAVATEAKWSFDIIGEVNTDSWAPNPRGARDFTIADNGTIYVVHDKAPYLFSLDADFNYIGSFDAITGIPGNICCDVESGLLYIDRSDDGKIVVYTTDGTPVDSIEDPAVIVQKVKDMAFMRNKLVVVTGGDSIISFNGDGNRVDAWYCGGTDEEVYSIADGGADCVAVGKYNGATEQVCWYTDNGNRIACRDVDIRPRSIAVDINKQHFYLLSDESPICSELHVYDHEGIRIGQYSFLDLTGSNGLCLLESGNPIVRCYNKLFKLSTLNQQQTIQQYSEEQ